MTSIAQQNSPFDCEDQREKTIPMAYFAPDCIADAGKVRQGGLRRVLPWLFATILGDGA